MVTQNQSFQRSQPPTQNGNVHAGSEPQTGTGDLAAQANLIGKLRNQIRSVETARRICDDIRISSGCSAIDRLLPSDESSTHGYQRGTLVQWLTSGGHCADYLSLLVAKEACADGGALVVFDPLHQFYPPAAAAIGINIDHLIILRSSHVNQRFGSLGANSNAWNPQHQEFENDLLWSIDQALRCPAVAAVWGPVDQINERWFRRFQLSAESSGCLGLFVQPMRAARDPSWAEVQWLVSHNTSQRPELISANSASEQQVRLQLTRCRGTQTGKTINLSINTVTGNVRQARRDHESHQRNRTVFQNRNTDRQPRSAG